MSVSEVERTIAQATGEGSITKRGKKYRTVILEPPSTTQVMESSTTQLTELVIKAEHGSDLSSLSSEIQEAWRLWNQLPA